MLTCHEELCGHHARRQVVDAHVADAQQLQLSLHSQSLSYPHCNHVLVAFKSFAYPKHLVCFASLQGAGRRQCSLHASGLRTSFSSPVSTCCNLLQ